MNETLTRRDAVAALLAGGVGIGSPALAVAELAADRPGSTASSDFTEADVSTLRALAEVIYPSAVSTEPGFVRSYVSGLPPERRSETVESVRLLDDGARRYTGSDFAALSTEERDAVLRRMGVDTVTSHPTGSPAQRVRYYLVNSLLYALFTTPTGSELFGIRNPTGHPGGYESLFRAPDGEPGSGASDDESATSEPTERQPASAPEDDAE